MKAHIHLQVSTFNFVGPSRLLIPIRWWRPFAYPLLWSWRCWFVVVCSLGTTWYLFLVPSTVRHMFSPICMLALLAAVAHRLTGTGVGTDAVLAVRVGAVFFGQTAAHRGSSQDGGLLRTVGWATAGDYSLDLLGELQPHACWVILKVATSCSVAVVRTVQAWQCCSNEGIAVCKPCRLFVGSHHNARPMLCRA